MGRTMVVAFRILSTGRLEQIEPETLLQTHEGEAASQQPHFWVDLCSPTKEELNRWISVLRIPSLLSELLFGPLPTEVVGNLSGAALVNSEGAYFIFPFYGDSESKTPDRFEGVCVSRSLLTVHSGDLPSLVAAQRLATHGDVIPSPNVSGLLAALLLFAANRNVERAVTLRRQKTKISDALSKTRSDIGLADILALDTAVETLSEVTDELLIVTRTFAAHDGSILDLKNTGHIEATNSTLKGLDRALDRLDRQVQSLRSQYDSRLTERTNRRLAALTVLSAVFMPLTLITGIYGMNFVDMPELQQDWAYQKTLGVMGVLATAMLSYFYFRGWFD